MLWGLLGACGLVVFFIFLEEALDEWVRK
jgi:hypothetical protein